MLARPGKSQPQAKIAANGGPTTLKKSQAYRFATPVRGWVTNESLAAAQPGGAYVLQNFFPTLRSLRVRGGSQLHATVGTSVVESLMTYKSGTTETLFACSDGSIFDITAPADAEVAPAADVTGRSENYNSSVMFSTVAGDYLVVVNGTDRMMIYDGTTWEYVDDATTRIAYDAESGAFTAGLTITGGTSTATAEIVEVIDNGTTGFLRVKAVSGTFQDNETITDTSTGSATTNIPSGVETLITITGVDTANFRHVWVYRNRLYFVGDGKTAWYLPVDSVGGAAADVSMNGVFKRGGNLMFGGTWSLDAGDGLDDKNMFISDGGEVAVYEGINPGDANTWSQVGLYETSEPLGQNATIKAGGDFLLATVDGLIPISSAINTDRAAISLKAVSRPIEPTWKETALTNRSHPWEVIKWPEKNMAIVTIPVATVDQDVPDEWGAGIWGTFVWEGSTIPVPVEIPRCWVVNLETGAWAEYTGWDTQCLAYRSGAVYFGTLYGKVLLAEAGGQDIDTPYASRFATLFEDMGSPGLIKTVLMARPTWTYSRDFTYTVNASTNYSISWGDPPNAASPSTSGVWDVGLWDVAVWDAEEDSRVLTEWRSIGRSGHAISMQVQTTSGSIVQPDAELVSMDVTYEPGGLVV